jgi:Fe-S-cluster containining protein
MQAQAGEIAGKSVEGEMAAAGVPSRREFAGGGARATRAMRYASDMYSRRLPAADGALIQIVDVALADAGRRSGEWLVCRPGCTQCCVGVFAINQLDAVRLQQGLADLRKTDPQRAARIRERARDSIRRLSAEFPGNAKTGVLDEGPEAEERFAEFANDEVCPVLDPETGLCDLYDARPMTCRTFGPPVRSEDGLGVCELCFHGASDEQIAACEMVVDSNNDPDDLEAQLLGQLEKTRGPRGRTLVAFCVK